MSVILSYHPLTHCVTPLRQQPRALQQWCRHKIIAWLGLKNLAKMQYLTLPSLIKQMMGNISLEDFLIDSQTLTEECYRTRVYPAKCLITNKQVILRIIHTDYDKQTCMLDTNYIVSFVENNTWIVVEYPIKTLAEIVQDCKEEGRKFDERKLWKSLHSLVQHIADGNLGPEVILSSDCIKYSGSHHFIQISSGPQSDTDRPIAVYNAPEVLLNDSPDLKALVWSIGCIVYEALALEPAFLDDSTNPFTIYIDITNGHIPAEPENGSSALKQLIRRCIVTDRENRMSFEELKRLVENH